MKKFIMIISGYLVIVASPIFAESTQSNALPSPSQSSKQSPSHNERPLTVPPESGMKYDIDRYRSQRNQERLTNPPSIRSPSSSKDTFNSENTMKSFSPNSRSQEPYRASSPSNTTTTPTVQTRQGY